MATSANIPFIIEGDWNIEATTLRDAGWVDHIGGSILRPEHATCNGHVFDLIVASSCLDFHVGRVTAWLDTPVGPHLATVVTFNGLAGQAKVWKRIAPSKFPLLDLDAEVPPLVGEWHCPDFSSLPPERAASAWFSAAEEVLCLRNGLPAGGDSKWCGRSGGCQVRLVPLRAAWGQDLHQRSNATTQAWLSIRRLATLYMKEASPQDHIRESAMRWGKFFPDALGEQLRAWHSGDMFDRLDNLETPGEAVNLIQAEVDARLSVEAAEARKRWRSWAQRSVESGGRVAHRYSKGPSEPPQSILNDPEAEFPIPLVGQDALDQVLKDWLPTWCKPSRDEEAHPFVVGGWRKRA